MGIHYTYPADPEYIEGFMPYLNAITGSFRILPPESSPDLAADAQQARQLAITFWEAYLAGDEEKMKTCLSEAYHDSLESFPNGSDGYSVLEVSLLDIKGLDFEQADLGDSCTIWMEFRPSAEADTLEYLTLELIKETAGWKIRFYGLEK